MVWQTGARRGRRTALCAQHLGTSLEGGVQLQADAGCGICHVACNDPDLTKRSLNDGAGAPTLGDVGVTQDVGLQLHVVQACQAASPMLMIPASLRSTNFEHARRTGSDEFISRITRLRSSSGVTVIGTRDMMSLTSLEVALSPYQTKARTISRSLQDRLVARSSPPERRCFSPKQPVCCCTFDVGIGGNGSSVGTPSPSIWFRRS